MKKNDLLLIITVAGGETGVAAAQEQRCDRACLGDMLDRYLARSSNSSRLEEAAWHAADRHRETAPSGAAIS